MTMTVSVMMTVTGWMAVTMTVTDWMTKNGKDNDGKGPNIENNDDDNGAHGEYNEIMIPFIYTIYI